MAVNLYVCSQSCGGIHVFIDSVSNHFGADGFSLCTSKETSTDFWPAYNGQVRYVGMETRTSGSCSPLPSYNTWMIEVFKNDKPGGPVLFNFRDGLIGADVYINGFL